jgi:hypothetical protein
MFFVTADSKRVKGGVSVSADSKEVAEAFFREKGTNFGSAENKELSLRG